MASVYQWKEGTCRDMRLRNFFTLFFKQPHVSGGTQAMQNILYTLCFRRRSRSRSQGPVAVSTMDGWKQIFYAYAIDINYLIERSNQLCKYNITTLRHWFNPICYHPKVLVTYW